MTGVGRSSHQWGSIGVIEREVSVLNLFQTPRPASPKVIFQNAKVLRRSNLKDGIDYLWNPVRGYDWLFGWWLFLSFQLFYLLLQSLHLIGFRVKGEGFLIELPGFLLPA